MFSFFVPLFGGLKGRVDDGFKINVCDWGLRGGGELTQ